MKLYTRLIEEGVFIFWNSDEGNTSYNLKIRIAVGDDKVELLNLNVPKGQNYYSFDKIGSGDYEIELTGYKDNRICQTEIKKIKVVSSAQKITEIIDKLSSLETEIKENITDWDHRFAFSGLCDEVSQINDALTNPQTIVRLRKKVADEEEWGWYR